MGLRSALRALGRPAAKAAIPDPSPPTEERWVEVTVRNVENLVAQFRHWNDSQKLSAYVCNLALDAALFNAKNLAGTPLRLYRRQAGSGVLNVRRVTKSRMRHLTNPQAVGVKAATMADVAGDVVEVMDHDCLSLLRRPNPYSTGTAWDVGRWVAKQCYGEALVLHTEAGNMVRLMNQFCRVQPDDEGLITGWYYGRETHDMAQYVAEDIDQQKWAEHPSNPYTGLGWLELAIREIEIDDHALASELRRWRQGGYPDAVMSFGMVKTGKQLTEAMDELKRQLKQRLGFLITGESTVTPLALPKDMQYTQGVEMAERRILNRAGIPESLYKLNDANLASSTTGHEAYAKYTLAPALAIDAEQWTEQLLPRYDLDPDVYFFAYDEVSERDRAAEVSQMVSLVGSRLLTRNEARAELDYPPVDGGDEFDESGGAFFGGGAGGSLLLGSPRPSEDKPVAPSQPKIEETALNGAQIQQLVAIAQNVAAGLMPKESGIATALAAFPGVPPEKIDAIFVPIIQGAAPTEGEAPKPLEPAQPAQRSRAPQPLHIKSWGESDPYAGCGHDHSTKADDRLPEEAVREFERLMAEYFRLAAANVTADAVSRGTIDLSKLDAMLAQAVEPLIGESVRVGGIQGYDKLGMEADFFDVAPDEAVRIVNERGNLVADLVGRTTEDAVRRAIADGVEQQLSAREIQKLVQEALGEAAPGRAEAIARTEVANAQGAGATAAWKEAGVEQNRWLLAPDACSICVALVDKLGRDGMASKGVPIDEPFIKAGETLVGADGRRFTAAFDVYHEPLHPNDRCTTLPVIPEAE